MKKGDLFPLADYYPAEDKINLRAMYTGEKRKPQINEWFLSGAIVEAYRASHNMAISYPIAVIVRVEVVTVTKIVEILKGV